MSDIIKRPTDPHWNIAEVWWRNSCDDFGLIRFVSLIEHAVIAPAPGAKYQASKKGIRWTFDDQQMIFEDIFMLS